MNMLQNFRTHTVFNGTERNNKAEGYYEKSISSHFQNIKVLCYLQSEKSPCSIKLIHFRKKLSFALDCRQSKYSLSIYFCSFGRGFCGSFSMLFLKAPASCGKKNLK